MPAWVKVVVQLPRKSGITADTIDNDWFFHCSDMDEISSTRADGIRDTLVDFYNVVHSPGTLTLASYIGDMIDRTANSASMKFYSVEETPSFPIVWGSPKQTRSWTLGAAASGVSMPSEVALCMTYHSDLTDVPETMTNPTPPPAFIRPAARRRGRIYLGPFGTQALSELPPNSEPGPIVGLVDAVVGAGAFVQGDLPANTQWNVLSQTEQTTFDVTGGWVDNAWDTQRRRGNEPDSRTTFTA